MIDAQPITAKDGTILNNELSLMKTNQNDDTYSRGQEETRGRYSTYSVM